MTKFATLSSGSSGNSVFIEHDGVKVIVDCGFSGRTIEKLIKDIGEDPSTIDAIFLTHEHTDHVKGAGIISRRFDIPIFANEGTWQGFAKVSGKIKEENIKVFKSDNFMRFKNMDILPIRIHHDANEPVGFVFYLNNKKITLLTDTGYVDQKMLYEIKGSDIYYFEANHDIEALKRGPYPFSTKKRIMSNFGHLSNEQSANYLADIIQGRREEVFLAHLSNINNTPDLSFATVDEILTSYGLDTKKDIKLNVAPRNKPSEVIKL
ncbi:MAG: MBL fold metallo-hydrolase [Tissierellia bacterium]|nr:MBL fold metallo-hydrolase [Tissierellia bacterium]